jgi:uncharacterized Zn finger protein (UPF0148 family)
MKKTLIELSHNIRSNKKMDELTISFCKECKTWTYRYNGQQCPICSDKREREKIAEQEKKRLERLTNPQ